MTRKVKPVLTCKKCKNSKMEDKYFPFCCLEHWDIALGRRK